MADKRIGLAARNSRKTVGLCQYRPKHAPETRQRRIGVLAHGLGLRLGHRIAKDVGPQRQPGLEPRGECSPLYAGPDQGLGLEPGQDRIERTVLEIGLGRGHRGHEGGAVGYRITGPVNVDYRQFVTVSDKRTRKVLGPKPGTVMDTRRDEPRNPGADQPHAAHGRLAIAVRRTDKSWRGRPR